MIDMSGISMTFNEDIRNDIRRIIADLKTKSPGGMDDYMRAINDIEEIVK